MSAGARAAIDIGSNSLLLTVIDASGRTVHDEARVVGLGRGLRDSGVFREDRLAAAEEVLATYAEIAAGHGVAAGEVLAVATSAARRATNAGVFFARIATQLGLRIRTVSGEEEAQLTWLGAAIDLDLPPGDRLVVDLGGGSTEIAIGDAAGARARVSLELGTLRLTEAHLCDAAGEIPDRYEAAAVEAMARAVERTLAEGAGSVLATGSAPGGPAVIGVAGTVTTLMATHLGLGSYDAVRIHGGTLTLADLTGFAERFARANAAERRSIAAVAPERADYLLAGSVVLASVLAATGADTMRVSDRGLRFGLLAHPQLLGPEDRSPR